MAPPNFPFDEWMLFIAKAVCLATFTILAGRKISKDLFPNGWRKGQKPPAQNDGELKT